MEENEIFEKFKSQYEALNGIIKESQSRIINEPADNLFKDNVNFFIKAYLINICTYLEAFLQELASLRLEKIKQKINEITIPYNTIMWCSRKEFKEGDMKFEQFSIEKTKKDISDQLSGNPYKTIKTFRLLGINLEDSKEFNAHKEIVGSIVDKRNNIIHHNDEASDISLSDLTPYITTFEKYSKSILEKVTEKK